MWPLLVFGSLAFLMWGRSSEANHEENAPTQAEGTTRSLFGALPGVFNVFSEPASEMDWATVQHFIREEFRGRPAPGEPEQDLTPYLSAQTVRLADELRERSGERLVVSPAVGAICRTYGNPDSDHYVGALDGSRVSHALDLMVPSGRLGRVGAAAEAVSGLDRSEGGFGVYPDWDPYPGVHISNGTDTGRWMALENGAGEQDYYAIDWQTVQRHLSARGLA